MQTKTAREIADGLRALAYLLESFDRGMGRRNGLNPADLRCLELLGQIGPTQPMKLAELLGYSTGGISTVIDRLEDLGYVSRSKDETDRRKRLVSLIRASPVPAWSAALEAELVELFEAEELLLILRFLRGILLSLRTFRNKPRIL